MALPPRGAAGAGAVYETPLSYLLWRMGVGHLVLCGQVTEQCVLYSALEMMERNMGGGVGDS